MSVAELAVEEGSGAEGCLLVDGFLEVLYRWVVQRLFVNGFE